MKNIYAIFTTNGGILRGFTGMSLICKIKLIFVILFLTCVFTVLLSNTVYAGGTYGIVTGDRVNIRSYGEVSDNRLFQVDRGLEIEIHRESGDFFRATILGESGVYIARDFVQVRRTTGAVVAVSAGVYDLPRQEGGEVVSRVIYGDVLTVTSVYDGWFGIQFRGSTAFIEQVHVQIPCFVDLPEARLGGSLADSIITMSMRYLEGARYLWGGTTPNGFDCSGFMVYLFNYHGIRLDRRARDQARQGVAITRAELMPGDLVFFQSAGYYHISHVGMYIGGGKFIHSTPPLGVIISCMGENYYARTFVSARRIILE